MARVETLELRVDTSDAQKNIEALSDDTKDLTKDFEKFGKQADKELEDIEKQSKKTQKGVKGVSNGFRALGTAMKAAGIGIVIALVAKLGEAFTRNQRIVDFFTKAMETVNILFSQVITSLQDAFDSAMKATGGFDALLKVMKGLVTIGITPLKNGFNVLRLGILNAQLAWEQSFFGDENPETIKRLNAEIKETIKNIAETTAQAVQAGKDIVDNFGEAIEEIGTLGKTTVEELSDVSISSAIAQADALVELRNQAQINEALIEKSIFQYQLLAERQRQIRDDETRSIEERIEANEELGRLLQQQQEEELKLGELRLAQAQAEVNAGNTSVEARIAVINAEKELLDIQERIAGFESEQQLNRNALERERLEQINARVEAEREAGNALIDIINKEAEARRKQKEEEILLEQKVQDAKKAFALKGLALIQEIAGRGSKIGKAVAVAQTIISGIQSVQETFKSASASPITTVFPAYPFIQAGLAGAFSALQLRAIKSTNVGTSTAPTTSGGGGGVPQAQAPNFNIVGQGGTNQLADALGQNSNRPSRAYVVNRDVSTAQELERNIVGDASLGE